MALLSSLCRAWVLQKTAKAGGLQTEGCRGASPPKCLQEDHLPTARVPLLKVRIKASKMDPFRKGVDVFVGKTKTELCPVTYMAGPGKGPFFRFKDGKPLTRE